MNKLLNRAIELFASISNIENINRGGCLYASYGVYKALKKELS